jgi:hypothetical protein
LLADSLARRFKAAAVVVVGMAAAEAAAIAAAEAGQATSHFSQMHPLRLGWELARAFEHL